MFRKIKNFVKFIKSGGVVYVNVSFNNPSERFNGKTVLVTGGSSGIGLQIAKDFLAEKAEVYITGRNKEKLDKVKQELSNDRLHTIIWDIADISKQKDKMAEFIQVARKCDIFINNAGIFDAGAWSSITQEMYEKINKTNAEALFFMCQQEGEYMVSHKIEGKIINIVSIAGIKSGFDPYSCSKWSASCITKGFAKEMVKHGILVNGIAPGNVVTNIHAGVRGKNVNDNAYMPSHLTNRYVLVEEISSMALYLSSDSANSIVGQVIPVDGGWTLQ